MSILLISRGTMMGGQIIGQCLAHTAGMRYVSREELIEVANAHGEIADRVVRAIPKAARDYAKFSELRRPYKILMRLALLEYASRGSFAYFGYSGHLLLEGISHMVKVRLIAPLELRTRLTMERLKCGEEEARDYIRQMDEERITWARFMYGKDIRDLNQYDLCINLANATFPTACEFMFHATQARDFQPTEESLQAQANLHLATRVEAELLKEPETFALEVSAVARGGHVLVEGPYLEEAQLGRVMELSGSVPGVLAVEYQPGYAPTMAF